MKPLQERPSIVVVEDNPDQSALVSRWLEADGMRVVVCPDGETFLDSLELTLPDVVCLDAGLPGVSGTEALDIVHRRHPHVPVLMLTAERSARSVVEAMRAGAYDYLTKPCDRDTLLAAVRRALRASEERRLRELGDLSDEDSYAGVIGRSPQMREVFRQVDRIAGRDISVLVRGESGTGKELIARAIHENSRRAGGPFVAINCAAIPESLQDSELFGHERGSFTGAHKARAGCFERADGGTLFLDEVAELSLGVQAKLLRVLQERRFDRLGGMRTVESDFRLVTATHRKLRDMVEGNRFREDLYFRIVVFEIELPPLRERVGDLRLLVPRVLDDVSTGLGSGALHVSESAMVALEHYPYPGNVRELENILQCAAVLAAGDEIALHDLPPRVREYASVSEGSVVPHLVASEDEAATERSSRPEGPGIRKRVEAPVPTTLDDLPLGLEDLERWAVRRALLDKNGRLTEVAKALGIGRTTLYRKLQKYGLR
ncbi:MAG: sigma-54 dependent transcriptional regulator [Polyangiales bacterium]